MADSFARAETAGYGSQRWALEAGVKEPSAPVLVLEVGMPTFVLLVLVLVGRLAMSLVRGVGHVLLLPARTALAVAPHMSRPRWILVAGTTASLALALAALGILLTAGAR